MRTVALGIEGMDCGSCASNLERRLYRVAGVESAEVSYAAGLADVVYDPEQTDTAALAKVVADAGYTVRGEEAPAAGAGKGNTGSGRG